ncbi:hypothetical protein BURPS1710b_A2479 [Burkholderia pseudomallei 1710b]|uniref:Uncharacterized protein n=1 Tax=Burkholderia pseudomallei (strain 1710b) TaxID=320372 RepID=Q3JFM4_BURP1|nr:hypothetical protein BURPS1710b_A2479 [Burkholderia pseudomallei 1710b]
MPAKPAIGSRGRRIPPHRPAERHSRSYRHA